MSYEEKYEGMTVTDMAKAMKLAKDQLEAAKKVQTEYQKEFDHLRLVAIPAAMDEMGVSSMKIDGVGRLTLSTDAYAGIASGKSDEAYGWLQDNGFEDLVTEYVHPSTLKAFLKEQFKAGNEFPEELFKFTPYERASITKA